MEKLSLKEIKEKYGIDLSEKKSEIKINNPDALLPEVAKSLKKYQAEEKEAFLVICLNSQNKVKSKKIISVGTLNQCTIHAREVFFEAIKHKSASIVIAHNHPSGDSSPSSGDIAVTKKIRECGQLLGIELLDHVIFNGRELTSLKQKCSYIFD